MSCDTFAKGYLKVLHQGQHTLLRRLREVLLGIDLSKGFSHHTIHLGCATLPKRMVLLTSREDTTIEVEVLGNSSIIQIVGCRRDDSPLQHVTIDCRFHAVHQLIDACQEVGLSDNEFLIIFAVDVLCAHQLLQSKVRITCLELFQRHLIVVGLRVTQFCARLADLSKFRLYLHHVLHLFRCYRLTKAKQLEHLGYVRLKRLTNLSRSLIVIQIIFLLSERQATLIDVQDILCRYLVISSETGIVESLLTIRHKFQQDSLQLLVTLGCFQSFDQRHHRSHTLTVTTIHIHRQFVEIAQFLFCGALLICVRLQF